MFTMNTSFSGNSSGDLQLTGSGLKLIACGSMLVDHIAAAFAFQGIPRLICRQVIGRLAFPLFCFLLAEGFRHTRRPFRYVLNILIFALVAEVPYDLALFNSPFDWLHQNTMFTLALGLVMFWLLDLAANKTSALEPLVTYAIQACIAAAACAAAWALHLDYSWYGILCLLGFYLLPGYPFMGALAAILLLNLKGFPFPGAFLAVLPICLYDGTRGRQFKYAFYLFYPAHLLVLALLKISLVP